MLPGLVFAALATPGQLFRGAVLAQESASSQFYRNSALGVSQTRYRGQQILTCLFQLIDRYFGRRKILYSDPAASRADQAGLKAAQVHALISAMHPLGFISPDRGLVALDQAVQMSVSAGDPLLVARTQMAAASCRLIFADWRKEHADLFVSAYERLRHLGESEEIPYQQMIFGHVFALQGRYREALDLIDTIDAAVCRTDHGTSLIPHVGAISAKTLILLRTGRLGDVLRITRPGRESADENTARSWLLTFREAWLRILVFDYEGARRISQAIAQARGEYQPGQPHTISQIAAGYIAMDRGEYGQAIECFRQIRRPEVTTKFFLHWIWRMTAQLESGNAWLLSGNIRNARTAADDFLESALSTADPHLQALAWDLKARGAMAESDLQVRGNRFSKPSRSSIRLKFWSRPGKSMVRRGSCTGM